MKKVELRAERVDSLYYIVLVANAAMPVEVAAVEGAFKFGGSSVTVALNTRTWNAERRWYDTTKVDYLRLGVVLDMCRDAGFDIDFSQVPGLRNRGIGG